jgi:hypothetical protein
MIEPDGGCRVGPAGLLSRVCGRSGVRRCRLERVGLSSGGNHDRRADGGVMPLTGQLAAGALGRRVDIQTRFGSVHAFASVADAPEQPSMVIVMMRVTGWA